VDRTLILADQMMIQAKRSGKCSWIFAGTGADCSARQRLASEVRKPGFSPVMAVAD